MSNATANEVFAMPCATIRGREPHVKIPDWLLGRVHPATYHAVACILAEAAAPTAFLNSATAYGDVLSPATRASVAERMRCDIEEAAEAIAEAFAARAISGEDGAYIVHHKAPSHENPRRGDRRPGSGRTNHQGK